MDQRRVILAGAIALVAAIVVLGVIMAVGGLLPGLFGNQNNQNAVSNLPVISASVTPAPTFTQGQVTPSPTSVAVVSPTSTTNQGSSTPSNPTSNSSSNQIAGVYNGDGFSLNYPSSWGLLTCSNSKNFELDPTSSTNMLNVHCTTALKAVTVLVREGNYACPGNKVTIGNYTVTKSVVTWSDGEVDYRWCVPVAGKTLDISHRTGPNGGRAVSTTDYSPQVEDMIKTLTSTNSPS